MVSESWLRVCHGISISDRDSQRTARSSNHGRMM